VRGAAFLLVAMAAAGPLGAGEGIFIVGGARPVSRSINGYVQEAEPLGDGRWRVTVRTEMAPLQDPWIRGRAPDGDVSPETLTVSPGFRMPASLVAECCACGNPFERARRVLGWVRDRIRLSEEERLPQDAASVLARRSARCSGLANVAVALLRASGLPARTVSGFLVTPSGSVPHRWLEVRLGDAGWVPSDPTLGVWVVTPRHVACATPAVGRLSVRVRRLHDDELDVLPHAGGMPIRPVEGARLLVRLVSANGESGAGLDGKGTVVLCGPGGTRREAALGRDLDFAALLPGRWRLRLQLGGRTVRSVSLHLRAGDVRSLVLPFPAMEASS